MKILEFNVNGQKIVLDPSCDTFNLIPGTEGYVQAKFNFSSEWDGCTKVAAFYSNLGREFEPRVLKNGIVCEIPAEALKMSVFKVKVLGQKTGYTICTNKVAVYQKGGNT